jgi:hypothetical protein
MTAFFGSTPITGIKFGSTSIVKVMFGSVPVWSPGTRDDFDVEDQIGLPGPWTRHGPSTSDTVQAAVRDGYARMNIPASLGTLAATRDEWRYSDSTLGADNGYIEVQLADAGSVSSAVTSKALARVSNTTPAGTALASGIGMAFTAKSARLTRRIGGTNTDIKCGSCSDGDTFRLNFNGNVHTLIRNNKDVGQWIDTGYTLPTGAGFQSMALSVMGAKEGVLAPRRFSAGLEYIEMGLLAA